MTSFLHISNKYYDLDYFCIQTCIGLIDIKNNMRYGDYVRQRKRAYLQYYWSPIAHLIENVRSKVPNSYFGKYKRPPPSVLPPNPLAAATPFSLRRTDRRNPPPPEPPHPPWRSAAGSVAAVAVAAGAGGASRRRRSGCR
jgi:hypothetical protein